MAIFLQNLTLWWYFVKAVLQWCCTNNWNADKDQNNKALYDMICMEITVISQSCNQQNYCTALKTDSYFVVTFAVLWQCWVFIDREAREIMYLVASVCPSVRPTSHGWTSPRCLSVWVYPGHIIHHYAGIRLRVAHKEHTSVWVTSRLSPYVCLSVVCSLSVANCDWLHSQKNSRQQMVMVSLLWQVGLIANIKLHFFLTHDVLR